MTQTKFAVVVCDNETGCTEWILDYYTLTVDNWRELMAGWEYDPHDPEDFALCPDCVKRAAEEAEEAKP